jgi:CubicO group peptidase (beta-lactamase class C family)
MKQIKLLLVPLALFLLISCGGGSNEPDVNSPPSGNVNPPSSGYTYQAPIDENDGLPTAHAEDFGISPLIFEEIMNEKLKGGLQYIDGISVIKSGKLIFNELTRTTLDEYDNAVDNTDLALHSQQSVSKSIISLLIGLAIDKGFISSVNEPVMTYLADLAPYDEDKQQITIQDFLTMQHGIEWDEHSVPYGDPENIGVKMYESGDIGRFVLSQAMSHEPGTHFAYSGGVSILLGTILERATGQTIQDFALEHLLTPLNITKYSAIMDTVGGSLQVNTAGGIFLTVKAMAKIGEMVRNNGIYDGQQIISSQWIQDSVFGHVDFMTDEPDGSQYNTRYGYQWWLHNTVVDGVSYQRILADGWGGQMIIIMPELDLVIGLTGHAYGIGNDDGWIMRNKIIAAVAASM